MATSKSTISSTRSSDKAASRPFPELPFVVEEGPHGARTYDHFAVPLESYGEGNQTGVRVAWELMRAYALEPDYELSAGLSSILKDAATALENTSHEDSKRGAAVGFFTALARVLSLAAKTSQWELMMDDILKSEELAALDHYNYGLKRNNEFRASMKYQAAGVVAEAKARTAEIKAAAKARSSKALPLPC